MKKTTLLLIITLYNSIYLFSQDYSIQNNNIIISLSNNDSINYHLIETLLDDSILNENCKTMILDGESIKIPPNLNKISWIEQLQINIGKEIYLNESFSYFDKLQELILYGGNVYIDERIYLKEIKYLTCQGVKFKENRLPNVICNWEQLQELSLIDCKLKTIPDSISNLVNLSLLSLCKNNIEYLTKSIYSLDKLSSLVLHENNLKYLSHKICEMKSLQYIHFDNNNNLAIPHNILNCLKGKIVSNFEIID